ncbi:MAG: alkylmercury lyase family protein [Theionarchaea archaeon]|nr:MAG: hypothetical protein AYK19_19770 [Theionarchaea archaeon DG-70-1]MBU7030097.1 alkylmercury lyase family protein [Theionarchaea archaeon]
MFVDDLLPTPTEKTEKLIKSFYAHPKKVIISKLSLQENEVRKYILTEYTRLGTAPAVEKIKEKFQNLDVDSILQKLDTLDFIYLNADKTRIECSYPFSTGKTIHEVEMDGTKLYCNCALDALGVPFIFGKDIIISSQCGFTGEPITIKIENKKIVSRTHSNIWVWNSYYRCGKSVNSCCKRMLFFTSSTALDEWVKTHPGEEGERLALSEALFISKYLFESFI